MAFAAAGIDLADPAALFGVTAVLSNLVSNVPAVMLLLPAPVTTGRARCWRSPRRWPATC